MTVYTSHADLDELGGGRFRSIIGLRPRNYVLRGAYRPIDSTVIAGDASFPFAVEAAHLRLRVAPDHTLRILPVPGQDDVWASISSPFIRNGGGWIQPSLGTLSRTANYVQATAANVVTRIYHAGHFVKPTWLLRNGWRPLQRQFAFRVGLSGLTRDGGVFAFGGVPVMSVRLPIAYNADDEMQTWPIAHEFVQLSGDWYILFTLPAETDAIARLVVDPTLTLQPGAADGKDAPILDAFPNTNYGNSADFEIGNENTVNNFTVRELIAFNLTALPATAIISAATLGLYCVTDYSSNARTFSIYRQLRAWTEAGVTWNKYNGVNNWQTAGGFGALDCEQVAIGSRDFTAAETLNEVKNFTLTPTTKAGLDLGNGWMVRAATEADDAYVFCSSDHATPGNRPVLAVTYTLPSGVGRIRHGGRWIR